MLFGEATGNDHSARTERKRSARTRGTSAFRKRRLGVFLGRQLQLEYLEDRRMMSVVPVDPPGQIDVSHSPTLMAAVMEAADLSQYTAAQLSQTYDWAVGYAPGQSPALLAAAIGATSLGPVTGLANSALFAFPATVSAKTAGSELAGLSGLTFDFPLVPIQYTTESFTPAGSLFPQEWQLQNTGQTGGTPGADANVLPAWAAGDLGKGVVIGVVDTGVYGAHPDLAPNYRPDLSYNFLESSPDASPPAPLGPEDDHGTAVAGVAAASGSTSDGTVGVAPQAQIAGIRAIGGPITDTTLAQAIELHNQQIQVYNNSWGPATANYGIASVEDPVLLAAMQDGAQHGRNGLGNVYVFAAGNGLGSQSDVNYAGLANSQFAIAVTGVDDFGKQTTYGVPGAAVLVAAPTGHDYQGAPDERGIPTTDVIDATDANGLPTLAPSYLTNDANGFNGTSSAAPVVSGVVALMLSANPNLSYRDVQMILAETATKNDPTDPGWSGNGASFTNDGVNFTPFHIDNKFGFGTVNAAAAVALAKQWSPLPAENVLSSPLVNVNQAIPDGTAAGVSSTITYSGQALHLEHVEVTLTATHPSRGDLTITLTSPDGTQSVLAATRTTDGYVDPTTGAFVPNADYTSYTFTSVRDWGEMSTGQWTLQVSDRAANGQVGTFNSWQLNLFGTTDYPPIADDFSANTPGSTPVSVGMTANTYDFITNSTAAGGEITIASQPKDGTVTYNPNTGIAVYTPLPGFSGVDTFTYLVTDAQGTKSRTATVSVNVGFVAGKPVAVDDSGSVALGSSAAIDVLANDSSPDGTLVPSSVTIVTQPQFGIVSVNSLTGVVTYTPGGAFQLTDSFQYDVTDSQGETSNVATVTIHRLSGSPVAENDNVTTAKNQAVSINVLGNDQQGAPDIPLDPSTVSIVTPTQNGALSVDPSTGAVTYTPKPNFFGTDSFTYTVSDIVGNVSNAALVSIVVSSAGAPVALDHEFVLVPGYNTIRGITALDNPTNSGSLTVQLVQQAALGTATLNPDGTFTYNQGPNFQGLDSFDFQVVGGGQVSNVGVIRVVSPQFHYVEKLYHSVLGRTGSDGDILAWTGALNQGVPRSDVALAFLNSPEYHGDLVNSIYEQLLGRPADFVGELYWAGQLNAGASAEQVTAAIASSAEYYFKHGGTNAGFVAGLYQDLLGRTASQAEIANWTASMAGASRTNVALAFLGSPEYHARLINGYYQSYLGHPADPIGLTVWMSLLQAGDPRTVVQAEILGSLEYFNLQ